TTTMTDAADTVRYAQAPKRCSPLVLVTPAHTSVCTEYHTEIPHRNPCLDLDGAHESGKHDDLGYDYHQLESVTYHSRGYPHQRKPTSCGISNRSRIRDIPEVRAENRPLRRSGGDKFRSPTFYGLVQQATVIQIVLHNDQDIVGHYEVPPSFMATKP
ncbi:hypothetical protein J6590_082565, partial [Homalodisca vitripennis]